MEKSINYIRICRYFLIWGPIIGTMVTSRMFVTPVYILLTLLLFINSQIRLLLLSKGSSIVSLLVELGLILYLDFQVGGYLILILLSTLMDGMMEFQKEGWMLSVLLGGALMVSLYQRSQQGWVFVLGLVILTLILLLLQLKQELSYRMDTEVLYDRIRRSNYELEEARTRLYNYSKQVERLSQLEERQRISRELHDTLGHHLTGILMQVDAARQILPLDQGKGLEILESAYDNINTGIEDVRRTVGRLRPTGLEMEMESIERLIEKCQRDTGLHIHYDTFGTPYELFPSMEITLYKNIREALTNALRHGKAKNVSIHLTFGEDNLELNLEDDGVGAENIKKGFGLRGMEERLDMVDGTMTYSGDQGFRIHMIIPRRRV